MKPVRAWAAVDKRGKFKRTYHHFKFRAVENMPAMLRAVFRAREERLIRVEIREVKREGK